MAHRRRDDHDFALDVTVLDGRPTARSGLRASHIYRLPLWKLFGFNIGVPALGALPIPI